MPDNLYERNGVFYARIQVAGADKRVSLKTKNRAEANRRLRPFLESVSLYHGTVRRSFDDVVDGYLLSVKPRLKDKTYQRYEVSALQLASKFSGKWWDEVTKKAVQEYIEERKAEGVKIPTIRRDLTVLSQAAEWAIDHDFGGANPVKEISKRALAYKRWKFTRPNERSIEATIAAAYGNLRALAAFLLQTGMRLDEAVNLRWDDVKRKRNAVELPPETKNGLPRAVSLNDAAMAILDGQDPKTEYVFPSRNRDEQGRDLPYKQASTNWQEAKARAQKAAQKERWRYTPFRLHDLRHIYAIEYLTHGGSIYWLQRQLGHGTIRQTEEYLDYLTPEEVEIVKRSAGTDDGTPTTVSD